jgi:RNase P/RNase MRP subunit POP5
MKIRNRYIAFIIHTKNEIDLQRNEVIKSIQQHCYQTYQKSCKSYGFFVTRFQNNTGILRCNHTEKNRAITLLRSIQHVNTKKVEIETLGTSGTIKSLIKKHLHGNPLK